MDVRAEWHQPELAWAAVFLRDGEPWYLDGALVGLRATPDLAVADLLGIARHLVIHGENFLTSEPLSLPDREWLFRQLDYGVSDDAMYAALAAARTAGGA